MEPIQTAPTSADATSRVARFGNKLSFRFEGSNISFPLHHLPSQVKCTSLPFALLHQTVMHPLRLLQSPFRKMERQSREADSAPLACPLASSCTCLVRSSNRLARHVAACHSRQLEAYAASVASLASKQALIAAKAAAKKADVSVGEAEQPTLEELEGDDGKEDAPVPPLSCSLCAMLVECRQMGLPAILDWGYKSSEQPMTGHGESQTSFSSRASEPERSLGRPHSLHGRFSIKGRIEGGAAPDEGVSVYSSLVKRPAEAPPTLAELAALTYATAAELEAHVGSSHEDLMLAMSAYVACLGSGWEGSACPLSSAAVKSEDPTLEDPTSSAASHLSKVHAAYGVSRHGINSAILKEAKSVNAAKGVATRFAATDDVSRPGVGRFVFYSVEELQQHITSTPAHVDHTLQVRRRGERHTTEFRGCTSCFDCDWSSIVSQVLRLGLMTVTTGSLREKLTCEILEDSLIKRNLNLFLSLLLFQVHLAAKSHSDTGFLTPLACCCMS